MTHTFKIGDTVRFAASFLKSIQWNTDVPDYGTVTEIRKLSPRFAIASVLFPGDDKPRNVNVLNLILASESHLEPV